MTTLPRLLLIPLLAIALLGASARGVSARQAPSRDMSGFWELPADGRRVPAASLVPGVTPAMVAERARLDAHAVRWCNTVGMPFIMDSGRPLDIRQGSGIVVIVREHYTAPRYLYLNRDAHISEEIYQKPHSYRYVFDRLPPGSYAFEDWCDASDPIERQSIVPPPQR